MKKLILTIASCCVFTFPVLGNPGCCQDCAEIHHDDCCDDCED